MKNHVKNNPLRFPKTGKIAVVVSRFNKMITQRLLDGCLDELTKAGIREKDVIVVWVPGAFELPLAALRLAQQKSVRGVICLGAVIRGETFHFELVAENAARGIMNVSLEMEKPVIFGVITADTVNQAYDRSKEKGNNKGRESVLALLEMLA